MPHRFAIAAFTAAAVLACAAASAADKAAPDASKPAATAAPKSAAPSAGGTSKPAKKEPAKKEPAPKLVDVNSASRDELKTLPGIGDAEADRIVKGRPYLTKSHLVTEGALTEAQYMAIRSRIRAAQESGDPTKALQQKQQSGKK